MPSVACRRLLVRDAADYSTVTETPGDRITREALAEMYTRYDFARTVSAGKDVLEVACGTGQGLGLLASAAKRVVGGDYSATLVSRAGAHYRGRIPVVRFDAHWLPFRDASFDVILLYEAVYYLARTQECFAEARRLLRPGGALIVCTTNSESPEFNPSPFNTGYLSAGELRVSLFAQRFEVDVYGAFPVANTALRDRLISIVRRVAVRLGLVPRTMKGKALLKRIFYGDLVGVPAELPEGLTVAEPLVAISSGACAGYRVVFAVARAA